MDRRAGPLIRRLAAEHPRLARSVSARTGLRLSPHYAGAHLARRLAAEPALARAARRGAIVAGPVASFVLGRIADRAPTACDPTLAQRTLVFDPQRAAWDGRLLDLFKIPRACLPGLAPTASPWGSLRFRGALIPILALAGDQQAAAAAFDLGGWHARALVNYGTGAFALWPSARRVPPEYGLLCSARADEAGAFYAEGTLNTAGAALDAVAAWTGWERLNRSLRAGAAGPLDPDSPLLVPAFAGLGAPHWDDAARPVLVGTAARHDRVGVASTRGSMRSTAPRRPMQPALRGGVQEIAHAAPGGAEEIARAALAGITLRIADIFEAGTGTIPARGAILLSGPLASIPGFARLQADALGRPVRIAKEPEATLRGIARIAARSARSSEIPPAGAGQALLPRISSEERARLRERWAGAVALSRGR